MDVTVGQLDTSQGLLESWRRGLQILEPRVPLPRVHSPEMRGGVTFANSAPTATAHPLCGNGSDAAAGILTGNEGDQAAEAFVLEERLPGVVATLEVFVGKGRVDGAVAIVAKRRRDLAASALGHEVVIGGVVIGPLAERAAFDDGLGCHQDWIARPGVARPSVDEAASRWTRATFLTGGGLCAGRLGT